MTSDGGGSSAIGRERQWPARYAIYSSIFLTWIFLIFCSTAGPSDRFWLAHWDRWDARWYEQIWLEGYPASDPKTLVFPPGYPYLVGTIAKLSSTSFIGTAVVVNLAAFFAAAAMISDWFWRQFGISPYLLFAFILSAPASYFSFTAYSDIVFMLLLWVLLWVTASPKQLHGNKGLIVQSSMLLVLPWIRLVGYALVSWLLDRRLAAFAVVVSLALWLGFNQRIAGSPFYFFHAQEIFAMPGGNFFQGLFSSVERLISNDLRNGYVIPWLQFAFLPLFYLSALTAVAIWLAKRGEGLLAVTILSILILSHNQSVWRSVVRYDLPLVPFLSLPLLGALGSRAAPRYFKGAFYVLLAGQLALQFIFARLFHSGAWAF